MEGPGNTKLKESGTNYSGYVGTGGGGICLYIFLNNALSALIFDLFFRCAKLTEPLFIAIENTADSSGFFRMKFNRTSLIFLIFPSF